jgi:hypothetical protein
MIDFSGRLRYSISSLKGRFPRSSGTAVPSGLPHGLCHRIREAMDLQGPIVELGEMFVGGKQIVLV